MPKLKTHQATAKRFKVTGRGKLRRRKQSYSQNRNGVRDKYDDE